MGLMPAPLFHLAIPAKDLQEARNFYVGILGASEGRSDERWVDFNFFGHQLVLHLDDSDTNFLDKVTSVVDGDLVPVPHFGVILDDNNWKTLVKRLNVAGWAYEIEPHVKFRNLPGEQWTMFIRDPSGNALEFKHFENLDQIFATE